MQIAEPVSGRTSGYRRSSRDNEAEKGKRLCVGLGPLTKRGGIQNSDRKDRKGDEEGKVQPRTRPDRGNQKDRNRQNSKKPAQVRRSKHLAQS